MKVKDLRQVLDDELYIWIEDFKSQVHAADGENLYLTDAFDNYKVANVFAIKIPRLGIVIQIH